MNTHTTSARLLHASRRALQLNLSRLAVAELQDRVDRVLALSREEYERLSARAKVMHSIFLDKLIAESERLAALQAVQADNQGGAI